MLFRIDPGSPEPIYQQLVRQISSAIQSGRLEPGEKLPSHRELALALVVNHLTVKRACDELERDGLLTTRRGIGTFVAEILPDTLHAQTERGIQGDLARAAAAARGAGLDQRSWTALCREAWEHTPSSPSQEKP